MNGQQWTQEYAESNDLDETFDDLGEEDSAEAFGTIGSIMAAPVTAPGRLGRTVPASRQKKTSASPKRPWIFSCACRATPSSSFTAAGCRGDIAHRRRRTKADGRH